MLDLFIIAGISCAGSILGMLISFALCHYGMIIRRLIDMGDRLDDLEQRMMSVNKRTTSLNRKVSAQEKSLTDAELREQLKEI